MMHTLAGDARPKAPARLAKSASIGLFASGSTIVANALTGLIVSRAVGAAGRGEFAVVAVFAVLSLSVGSLGLPEAISTRIVAPDDSVRSQMLVLSGIAALPTALVAIAIALLLGATSAGDTVLRQLLVLAVLLPIRSVGITATFGVLAVGRVALHQMLIAATSVLTLVAVAATWILGYREVEPYAWAAVAGSLAPTVLQLFSGRHLGLKMPAGPVSRTALNFGLRSWIGSMANSANQKADLVVLAAIASPAAVGIYANASSVASIALVAPTAFGPRIRWAVTKADADGARRWLVAVLVLSIALATAGAIGAAALFGWVYGEEFSSGRWIAAALTMTAPLLAGARVLAIIVATSGSPGVVAKAETLGLLVGIATLLALFPFIGLWAAVVGSAAGYGSSLLAEKHAASEFLTRGSRA